MKFDLSKKLCAIFAIALSGCGGVEDVATSTTPSVPASVLGHWLAKNSSNDSYEFFEASNTAPHTKLKMGRIFKGTELKGQFFWVNNTDGSVSLNKVSLSCEERPIDKCPVIATASIILSIANNQESTWKISFDDNKDGVVDRVETQTFVQPNLDLASLPQGEFFMNKGELFDSPLLGVKSGNKVDVRLEIEQQPVTLSVTAPSSPSPSVSFTGAGETNAVNSSASFTLKDGTKRTLPTSVWVENVHMTAGVNNGFILEYELRKKVKFPTDLPAANVDLKGYEDTQKISASYGRIDRFVAGPKIKADDKYATFLPADFNRSWVILGAGNEVKFTSSTHGVFSHTDFNSGKYSERRDFTWSQNATGKVTLNFDSGLFATINFVRDLQGGYQVLYTLPHPTLGRAFFLHDLIVDQQAVLTENDLVGRYEFVSTDGSTVNQLTIHKDKTVTGVVGGHWFRDTNGDFVGYECFDLLGRDIADFSKCNGLLNDPTKAAYIHIRRLRFTQRNGNDFLIKYDGNIYGAPAGIFNRDYLTAALTYRFKRVGNE